MTREPGLRAEAAADTEPAALGPYAERPGRLEHVAPLADRPLDAGGIVAVRVLAVTLERALPADVAIRAWRPTLASPPHARAHAASAPHASAPEASASPESASLRSAAAAEPAPERSDAPLAASALYAAPPRAYRPLTAAELGEPGAALERVRFEHDGDTVRAQIPLPAGTSLYGTGEVAGPLLRNGRATELWNTDAYRYGARTGSLYQSHPLVVAVLADGRALAVIADTFRRGVVVTAADGVELAFEAEPFDVLLVDAPDPPALARALAALLGPAPAPPAWALGYHQCRYSYGSATEVRRLARELRARAIGCDALWLDIDSMDGHRSFTWHPERFPDSAGLVRELHAQGFRVVAILDPGIAASGDNPLFAEGLAGGHFVRKPGEGGAPGELALGRVWPGVCAFPDFTRAATRAWWAGHVERFARDAGLDGLWVDMNEPALFRTPARTLPDHALHAGDADTPGGPHRRVHNLYGELCARATREGLERALAARSSAPQSASQSAQSAPSAQSAEAEGAETELADAGGDRVPFVLTRASGLGGARVAATWTGDNQSRWDDLAWSIPMVLNLALSGQPWSGPDVGGFTGDATGELYARWHELSCLLPFVRGHAEKNTARKEPWSFGPRVEAAVRAALLRRARLAPTLVALAAECAREGLPPVRPLFWASPTDPALRAVDDAYLVGTDLLVAPIVVPGAARRRVRLPRSPDGLYAHGWYRWPEGGPLLDAAEVELALPLGASPVLARAGAVVLEALAPEAVPSPFAVPGPLRLRAFLDPTGRARGRDPGDPGAPERSVEVRLAGGLLELDGLGARERGAIGARLRGAIAEVVAHDAAGRTHVLDLAAGDRARSPES